MTITENTTSPVGVIEYLDPNTLIIEENVRPSADLNRDFVQSIRANGVLTPVRARRDAEGRVLVRAGQRRTLAAREVGLATIAVHIIDGDEATAERIVQQLVENDQRLALTDADRTVAFKQLEFGALTPAAISKRTGTKTATVKTTLQVANTPAAADAMTAHQLTLDQAAGLVELDDDEETRAALIKTAVTVPAQFEHELQRARDERARREALQAAIFGRAFRVTSDASNVRRTVSAESHALLLAMTLRRSAFCSACCSSVIVTSAGVSCWRRRKPTASGSRR